MASLPAGLEPGTWIVDAAHSEFAFIARHAGISKVRGQFVVVGGEVTFAEEFEEMKVVAVAVASTVRTHNRDRDEHLKTHDFFLARQHPLITFTSLGVTEFDGSEFILNGHLTTRGITKDVTFYAAFNGANTDPDGRKIAGFSAFGKVNRKDYGMDFGATIPGGDMLVSDTITIEVDLELKQAPLG